MPRCWPRRACTMSQVTKSRWPRQRSTLRAFRMPLRVPVRRPLCSALLCFACAVRGRGDDCPNLTCWCGDGTGGSSESVHVGSQEWSWTPPTNESLASAHMAFAAPTQINYVAKAAKVLDPRTPPSGAWDVVASSLRTSYLWDRVRVQVWMARSCLCVLLWASHVTLELRCSQVYTHKANHSPLSCCFACHYVGWRLRC